MTLQVRDGPELRNMRARIAWVQRPQSIRDFFEVAVELESPGNVWGIECLPEQWGTVETSPLPDRAATAWQEPAAQQFEANRIPVIVGTTEANVIGDPINEYATSPADFAVAWEARPATADPRPLLRDVAAEFQRQADQATQAASAQSQEDIFRAAQETEQRRASTAEESFRKWKENLDQAQSDARNDFSAHLSAKQEEFLTELKLQFEERFAQASQVLQGLDEQTRTAREAESDLAGRAEQARLQLENQTQTGREQFHDAGFAAARWNERVDLELGLAQAQWNELLQSSLDGGIERLAKQLSERSQDVLRNAEERMASRFAELRQPLAETSAEAREALTRLRSDLEHEVARARASLVEIEHVANRLKDYSSQFEASSHDTLNELHRRLENILEGHTQEMNRHAENLVAGMSERLTPTFDSLGGQLVERTTAEVESRLAPYLERVPGLIRDLSAREMLAEESLRLQRERLRQLSENNQRDVASQIAATLSVLRNDFEEAGKGALAKWNEELHAGGSRAVQSVSESIGQTSEWFQNEARARLQVVVEQVLATAKSNCDDINAESAQRFVDEVGSRAALHLHGVQQQLENAGNDVAGRTRSTLDEAAGAAAASFGQLLQSIAGNEAEHFVNTSRNVLQERTQELERSAQEALGNLSLSGEASLDGFRQRMASEIERTAAEGRHALAAELVSMLERFTTERGAREQEWALGLERLSEGATERHQDRLQTACDAWLVSSVRRLNEHGQNAVESLMRSAEQALRDSCSKVFESLAEMMRGRPGSNTGFPGFAQATSREAIENPPAQ
ncbi:MAG: hypothetical protein ABSA57_07715 [Candidatus Acidiferrales bacterium]